MWITARNNKNEVAKGKSKYQYEKKKKTEIGLRMY